GYILNILAPQPEVKLRVRSIDGGERELQIAAKVREVPQVIDLSDPGVFYRKILREIRGADRDAVVAECIEPGEPLALCRLRELELEDFQVDRVISVGRKHRGLILDLRDNPGGAVPVLDQLLGGFFDHEVKIADPVARRPMKPQVARPGKEPFTGKLVVLVDSNSASASEVFARVIQLEKRGTILGDRSGGMVMQGRLFHYKLGAGTLVYFGAMITDADLVMPDGHSLERKGVSPDELILPSAANLYHDEDPVLARAAELLGVKMTPAEAAKLFPYEWPH